LFALTLEIGTGNPGEGTRHKAQSTRKAQERRHKERAKKKIQGIRISILGE
jgi:hypothetical protein